MHLFINITREQGKLFINNLKIFIGREPFVQQHIKAMWVNELL